MPTMRLDSVSPLGTPLTRISWRTGSNASVPLFQLRNTVEAVTSPTVSPLGGAGGVVSDTVVAIAGALGDEPLKAASNAVTWKLTVWPGCSPVHVAVVAGCVTETTPLSPSPQSE